MRWRELFATIGGAMVAGAASWPLGMWAQPQALPVIGILDGGAEGALEYQMAAFRQGLGEQGYVEHRNVEILYRWGESRYDRLPSLAADLVRRHVALIYSSTCTPCAHAATSATATIPIVFVSGADPVDIGLVTSLNRPGANATGVSFLTTALIAKRLQLLHEIVPAVTTIGYLVNPTAPQAEAERREAETAARVLGVRLVILSTSTPREIEGAFAILAERRAGALLGGADTLFMLQRAQLTELASRHALPAIHFAREFVEAGGLMSYGANISDADRLAGNYAGRILKGEKPTELPVQQSTKVELAINLRTAKALGLEIPPGILAIADEVIE